MFSLAIARISIISISSSVPAMKRSSVLFSFRSLMAGFSTSLPSILPTLTPSTSFSTGRSDMYTLADAAFRASTCRSASGSQLRTITVS